MNARSTERLHGFTTVELVAVLLLIGILAAIALPKLSGLTTLRSDSWRDQAVAGLRLAAATAQGHRRLVCADFAADGTLSLSVASANPASGCDSALKGTDGSTAFSTAAGTSVAVSPAGTLYFQPDGRVSTTGASGSVGTSRTISAVGLGDIQVQGESGHAQ